ncbi:MAG: DUF2911 domain-containing protein [Melioribacteraceae bacterium]|nr:DUF2911 domain-containing protein [Melioribacteraceae bacterium]
MLKYKFSLLFLFLSFSLTAQNITMPRVSPQAEVKQIIGVTEITINYSRPAVKGRTIWGELVPYGLNKISFGNGNAAPWRAGANENTTIEFSTDVMINGSKIPKGKYGLFMEVGKDEWKVIFNKVNTAWGNYFYDPNENVLVVSAVPVENQHTEWLEYSFENIKPNGVDAVLKWEKLKVPFTIEVDLTATILNDIRNQLVSSKGFNYQSYIQAVNFCLRNNVNLDEALEWINKSISIQETLVNLSLKAAVLATLGRNGEIDQMKDQLNNRMEISNENDINLYGYTLVNLGRIDEALTVFKYNVDHHPESWNVYDSYAEAFALKGEKEKAKKYYEEAIQKAPEDQKERLRNLIDQLEK